MKIIFTEFFVAYLFAECQKKVVAIIFYFAWAVSPATVERDCLCFFSSLRSPRAL